MKKESDIPTSILLLRFLMFRLFTFREFRIDGGGWFVVS